MLQVVIGIDRPPVEHSQLQYVRRQLLLPDAPDQVNIPWLRWLSCDIPRSLTASGTFDESTVGSLYEAFIEMDTRKVGYILRGDTLLLIRFVSTLSLQAIHFD